MWNLGNAWGDFVKKNQTYKITVADGTLSLSSLTLGGIGIVKRVCIDKKTVTFTQDGCKLIFESTPIQKLITIEV